MIVTKPKTIKLNDYIRIVYLGIDCQFSKENYVVVGVKSNKSLIFVSSKIFKISFGLIFNLFSLFNFNPILNFGFIID